jgi:MerR family redox-sensitive transcriptional activator SoxR
MTLKGSPAATDLLSIGELATRTGLSVSAIRFYEERGLVAPMRNAGKQRRFPRSDIRRLSFVLIAQQIGFTIEEIGALLAQLPRKRTPTLKDWEAISRDFRRELDARITAMTRMRDNLDGCIGCGCLSLKKCQLYNPADRVRRHGPGPRFLLGETREIGREPGGT